MKEYDYEYEVVDEYMQAPRIIRDRKRKGWSLIAMTSTRSGKYVMIFETWYKVKRGKLRG